MKNQIKKKDKIEKVDALQEGFHIVLPKETKYGLSKKHKISISELEQLNPQIKNNLAVGTRLLIPKTEKTEKLVVLENVDLLNKTKTISKE